MSVNARVSVRALSRVERCWKSRRAAGREISRRWKVVVRSRPARDDRGEEAASLFQNPTHDEEKRGRRSGGRRRGGKRGVVSRNVEGGEPT